MGFDFFFQIKNNNNSVGTENHIAYDNFDPIETVNESSIVGL